MEARILLRVLSDKENYDKYKLDVQEYLLPPEAKKYLAYIEEYFRKFPEKENATTKDFSSWTCTTVLQDQDQVQLFRRINKAVLDVDTTSPVYADIIEHYKRMHVANRVVTEGLKILDGNREVGVQDLRDVLDEAGKEVSSSIEYVDDDIEKLATSVVGGSGLDWRMEELNQSLGPIRKGDFVVVGARPETGKTTFLASEVTYMAEQTDGPVLWVNNEERSEKVMWRIVQAYLGRTKDDLEADLKQANKDFAPMKGRIRVVGDNDYSALHYHSIEQACREIQPSLIVIDVLDKIYGHRADRDDLLMEAKYQWARKLAKDFAPVIGTSQADASATNVRYIGKEQLARAKTAKPGEADAIITIGEIVDPPGMESVRFLNICKNKLAGGPRTKEELRHGKFEVVILPAIARYKGSLKR